jgi:hypothetical protein
MLPSLTATDRMDDRMHRLPLILTLSIGLALIDAGPALAYFGPGAGITMLTALWGVILAVLLAIGAILVWPVRALLRRRRQTAQGAAGQTEAGGRNQAG